MANGLTRESVHDILDATVVKAIPDSWRRIDLKIFEQMKEGLYQVVMAIEDQQVEQFQEDFEDLSWDKKLQIAGRTIEWGAEIADQASHEVFGKNFADLTPEEIISDKFQTAFDDLIEMEQLNPGLRIQEIAQHLEDGGVSGDRQMRRPSNAIGPLFIMAMTAYSIYASINDMKELYDRYQTEQKQGQTFKDFVSENKIEMGLLSAEVLLAVVPTSSNVIKSRIGVISLIKSNSRRLRTERKFFLHMTKRLMNSGNREAKIIKNFVYDKPIGTNWSMLFGNAKVMGRSGTTWELHGRVANSMRSNPMREIFYEIDAKKIVELAENTQARKYINKTNGNVNIVQFVDGAAGKKILLRITKAPNEPKIISVGRPRLRQVKNMDDMFKDCCFPLHKLPVK